MKKILVFISGFFLLFYSCKKSEPVTNPVDQLPSYTQTGANTFGCLVNGKVFLPQKPIGALAVILQCEYQMVNGTPYLELAGNDYVNNNSVVIGTDSIFLSQGLILHFSYPGIGNAAGASGPKKIIGIGYQHTTINNGSGELNIKNLDTKNQIISGTFWFDAIDTVANDTIHITEGRFDVHYTI